MRRQKVKHYPRVSCAKNCPEDDCSCEAELTSSTKQFFFFPPEVTRCITLSGHGHLASCPNPGSTRRGCTGNLITMPVSVPAQPLHSWRALLCAKRGWLLETAAEGRRLQVSSSLSKLAVPLEEALLVGCRLPSQPGAGSRQPDRDRPRAATPPASSKHTGGFTNGLIHTSCCCQIYLPRRHIYKSGV